VGPGSVESWAKHTVNPQRLNIDEEDKTWLLRKRGKRRGYRGIYPVDGFPDQFPAVWEKKKRLDAQCGRWPHQKTHAHRGNGETTVRQDKNDLEKKRGSLTEG